MRKSLCLLMLLLICNFTFAQATEEAKQQEDENQIAKKTNDVESWYLEKHEDGKSEMMVEEDAIVFKTTQLSTENWHVQCHQNGLAIEEGKLYTVSFSMKSPERVLVTLNACIHEEDWHNIGLTEEIVCQTDYQEYDFEFRAFDVSENSNRVGFLLGNDVGTVFIKNFSIKEVE